ncbi:MAG: glycosyltransferase family 4 protein [Gammaproteobacteria bacterium]|nr:glycosyltransferase family 4 protein [Gammaproteobacteria bacterium]
MTKNRKNILWLSHLIPYPPFGGVLQRSYNLVKELSRYHNVYILAFNQKALLKPFYSDIESGLIECELELKTLCYAFEYIDIPIDNQMLGKPLLALKSLFGRTPYTLNWLRSKEYEKKIENWLEVYNFDVVHFDTISLDIFRKFFKGILLTLDHHNIESDMMLRRANNERNVLKKIYYFLEGKKLLSYEKENCKYYSKNIVCSYLDKERLVNSVDVPLDVDVIPNGVDLDYFLYNHHIVVNKKRVVFAGLLSAYWNKEAVDYLMDNIYFNMLKKVPDIIFDIIGPNPSPKMLEFAKSEAGFIVHGAVPDVRPYLEQASVYLCPIMDGGGTKLKILDAMALGKAIVAHPIACEGIDVKHNESIMFAKTAQQFIEYTYMLLNTPSKIKELGENARAIIEKKYAYSAIGENFQKIFSHLG